MSETNSVLHSADQDIGRNYADPTGAEPSIRMREAAPYPWANTPVKFSITSKSDTIERPIYYPHLAFLKLIKDYKFNSIMDIGAGDGNEADLLKFLKKTVFTINADTNPSYKVDFLGEYMDLNTPHKFDAIWCSHVLEHVRNPGEFLDKIYDDMNDGGVLALSVPYSEFNSGPDTITIGHHNRYNFLLLVYQLVCAGFDCNQENFSMRIYNGQISVLLCKKPNGISRSSMAEHSDITRFFPVQISEYSGYSNCCELNWKGFFKDGPDID